jgi:hypothetical protein
MPSSAQAHQFDVVAIQLQIEKELLIDYNQCIDYFVMVARATRATVRQQHTTSRCAASVAARRRLLVCQRWLLSRHTTRAHEQFVCTAEPKQATQRAQPSTFQLTHSPVFVQQQHNR